ncbi:MAG: hypothetical protein K2Z81_22115, partial [Cyanobacteria bacterium]|nr:hypothetical protein [Cyanobacteriota bacterium]
MYKRRFATVIHCLLALNLICSLEVQAVPTLKSPNEIPKQIRDALGELQVVTKTPVLMPTWLPASSSGPLGVGRGPFKDGYEIWLGSCSADTTFFMSGGKGKIVRTKRKAKLKDGTVAYVQTSLKDFCMDWSADSCCYRVGKPSQGSAADLADLVKIANSLKVVPLAVMKTQPVGENRIVESIKLEQKSNALTQNIKIGDLYYSAVKNTVEGNYSKAEAELNELIAKWKDCFQMPPLAQAQMALVMVLKKENKLSEAAALEKKCADSARKLEGAWQAQIKAKHEEFVALGPEEKKESRLRVEIGKQRTNLADLYLTQGKFSLAENTYKAAFVDVASTYGRNHYEAVAIAEHYENLLRLNGRSPDPAKQLIQLKPTG